MSFTADINSNNQSFFSYGCNFCVLCVTIHYRYLTVLIRFFTNRPKSVILFYSEVFLFLNLLSWNSLYLNYTGSSFKAYAVSTGSNTQHLGYWTYAPTGTMYLKTSANTAMTDNNSCYSLGNAVYGVYSNSACTTKVKVGTLTTGTNGVSNPISVNEGTYYRSTI